VGRFQRAAAADAATAAEAARAKTGATGGAAAAAAAAEEEGGVLAAPPPNALPLSRPARSLSTTPSSSCRVGIGAGEKDDEEEARAAAAAAAAFCVAATPRLVSPPPPPPPPFPLPSSPTSPAVLTPLRATRAPPVEAAALFWLLGGGAKAGRSVPTLATLAAGPVAAVAATLPPPAAAPPPLAEPLALKNAKRLDIAWSKSEGVASRRRTQADSCERGPKPPPELFPPLPLPLPFPPPPKANRSSAKTIAP